MSVLAAAALTVALGLPGIAHSQTLPAAAQPRPCTVPLDTVRLANPLPRVAHKLASGEPITIVAMGSSSTAGAGASSPAMNYPNRLQVELSTMFPRQKFVVQNRGVNGEEIPDMLKRFDEAIIDQRPDLVLWQLGSNTVLHDNPISGHTGLIRHGLDTIKSVGADIVLMDPQFAPKIIVKPQSFEMVDLIAQSAKVEHVDLFHRFELMKRWHDVDHMAFEEFVTPDGVHMNDWGYGCVAKAMAAAIAEAATRPVATATAQPAARVAP